MLAAAKICGEPSDCWSERAKEAIRTVDTPDRSAFEKRLIFRLMYLRDVRESALSNADVPATILSTEQRSMTPKAGAITPPPCWESWTTKSRHGSGRVALAQFEGIDLIFTDLRCDWQQYARYPLMTHNRHFPQ